MKLTPASSETKSSKAQPTAPAINYKLSNEVFKTLGWTSQPENAVVVPVVTMKAKFSHSFIGPWFASKEKSTRTYKDGRVLCVANGDGTGRIYYPNGRSAILIKRVQNGVTWIIVKSPGGVGRDGVRHRPAVCAIFDSLGNGVVYDSNREKRMVYDQNHGMVWMKSGGLPVYWRWHGLRYAGSLSEDFEEHLAREHRGRRKETSISAAMKTGSTFAASDFQAGSSRPSTTPQPTLRATTTAAAADTASEDDDHYVNTSRDRSVCPMRPIVFQINSHVGVHILSQSEVALTFYAEGRQTRLNIGTLYNPYDRLSVDKVYSSSLNEKVWCPFEVLPLKTRSMEILGRLIGRKKTQPCWNQN